MQKGSQLSVEIKLNENNGRITDRCKHRMSRGHIGFVKDHGGHLVIHPC